MKEADVDAPELPFAIQYDYQEIALFKHDADELRALMVSSVADKPRLIMVCMQLWQILHSLERIVPNRKSEIDRIAPLKEALSDSEFANIYFGIHDAAGNVDLRLLHTMEAIKDQLDSSIFFSDYIASKLSSLSEDLSHALGNDSYKPISWDLTNIKDPTLLPDPNDFPDWK